MQDVEFRQAIEKQLNRGENSNKFSKAVAFGNNQEILFEEKEEQEVAENCRQLVKNAAHGRMNWQRRTGYNQRNYAELAMRRFIARQLFS